MIKIKLIQPEIHRNECTFRPYIAARNTLAEIGLEFTNGSSYDYAWVAQASFLNKKVSLQQSTEQGLEFLNKITGPCILFDGQDSTSLMGSYEVFTQSKNALLLLKSSLLKDRELYKQAWKLGRYYWGQGDYKLVDFDKFSDRIKLSGSNWISTHWEGITHEFFPMNKKKDYDISAMFQYPSLKEVYEHNHLQNAYYDGHRQKCINILRNLQSANIAQLINGERVSLHEYYKRLDTSKIIVAPFGYGEMAPRDLEASIFGAILIKPDMSYIDTVPNIFENNKTYIPCKHDFSDLQEICEKILGNYKDYLYIIENSRKKILEEMKHEKLALHLYDIFKTLPGLK